MRFIEKITEDKFEPEVEQQLLIDRIDLPNGEDYEGSITEEQLAKFDKQVHPLILADSRTVRALEHLWSKVVVFNHQVRRQHAAILRSTGTRYKVLIRLLEIVVAALTGALFSYLFRN